MKAESIIVEQIVQLKSIHKRACDVGNQDLMYAILCKLHALRWVIGETVYSPVELFKSSIEELENTAKQYIFERKRSNNG